MQKYIGHDGKAMSENKPFYFAKYFDWVITSNKIYKKTNIPKHIYIKLDYLNKYLDEILKIKTEFILISGCSDFSPQVSFKESYIKILKMHNLKKWYAENNLSNNPKMYSLTVGFATHTKQYEDDLLKFSSNINISIKIDKIFCCWMPRFDNVCGNQYVERTYMVDFIKNHNEKFDFYKSISKNEFHKKLSMYKWCLCPLGNGVDCAPKIVECFFLKTIPIIKKNFNVLNLYKNYPVIFVDDFKDVLNMKLTYDSNIDWNSIINTFTCEYWYNKIIS